MGGTRRAVKRKGNGGVSVPQHARTYEQLCRLPRDNMAFKTWWVLLGGNGDPKSITFCQQQVGESSTGAVHIPRRELERFIRWYTTGSTAPGERIRYTLVDKP